MRRIAGEDGLRRRLAELRRDADVAGEQLLVLVRVELDDPAGRRAPQRRLGRLHQPRRRLHDFSPLIRRRRAARVQPIQLLVQGPARFLDQRAARRRHPVEVLAVQEHAIDAVRQRRVAQRFRLGAHALHELLDDVPAGDGHSAVYSTGPSRSVFPAAVRKRTAVDWRNERHRRPSADDRRAHLGRRAPLHRPRRSTPPSSSTAPARWAPRRSRRWSNRWERAWAWTWCTSSSVRACRRRRWR